jgi:hypothetical protein
MRFWGAVKLWAVTSLAFSQEQFPGTKTDLAHSAGQSSGLMPLFQMAIVAGVILMFLKVWLPKILNRVNRRISTKPGGGISIEESATFAGGTLYVVTARGKTLLLSASTQGVNCLADLTSTSAKADEPSAFIDVLESVKAENSPSLFLRSENEEGAGGRRQQTPNREIDVDELLRSARGLVR